MTDIQSICVYLGSSGRADAVYQEATVALGRAMAAQNLALVYGGGNVGLMGLLANTVLENGGRVIGIIPEHLSNREVAHKGLTELHIVESMHARKQMMVEKADAFVIMPGGVGTLDETCEVLTWKQLGMHDKPIVLADINGYWQPFIALIDHVIGQKFMREGDRNLLTVVPTVEGVLPAVLHAPREKFDPASKWV